MSEPRKWTLEFDSNFDDRPPIVSSGPPISGYESEVEVIEYSAYERLERALERSREALKNQWPGEYGAVFEDHNIKALAEIDSILKGEK